jgi:hypothetical protein
MNLLSKHRIQRCHEVYTTARPIIWWGTISALICGLPLLLLLDSRSVFNFDWFNHLWMIEYFGEYIRRHGTPPAVLATENLVGITMPMFYAGKFYSFTGIVSAFLGSAIAFRIVAFCSLMIQFWHSERAAQYACGNKAISMTVATVISWAIYPITNLYNRSALTEFIAVIYLNAAVCCLFVLLLRHSRGEKSYYDAVAIGFFYSISAVTHPLTAAFGAAFLLSIGACFLFYTNRKWFFGVGLINATLVAGVLGSWMYLLHRYSSWLQINDLSTNRKYFREQYFFPGSVDNLWSLLSPVALDLRTLQNGVKDVSTPFLDAQINLPLLLIGIALVGVRITSKRGSFGKSQLSLLPMMVVSVFLFGLALSVAINPNLSAYLGGYFDILQFSYRLTTYLNLAALTFLLAIAGSLRNLSFSCRRTLATREAIVLGVSLGVSFSGLVTKLIHANAARFVDPHTDFVRLAHLEHLTAMLDPKRCWVPLLGRSPAMLRILPTTFYSHSMYMVREGFSSVRPPGFSEETNMRFLPAAGKQFGYVAPAKIALKNPTYVVTNVQPFPWNQIFVNGRQQKNGNLVATTSDWAASWTRAGVLALPLEAGEYTIEYRFRPAKIWRVLDDLSYGVLVVWSIVWIVAGFYGIVRNSKKLKACAHPDHEVGGSGLESQHPFNHTSK